MHFRIPTDTPAAVAPIPRTGGLPPLAGDLLPPVGSLVPPTRGLPPAGDLAPGDVRTGAVSQIMEMCRGGGKFPVGHNEIEPL